MIRARKIQKDVPLIVSGAGAWQRGIHKPFQKKQMKSNPRFKSIWSKGKVWGFTHFEIDSDKMIVKMFSTPNNGMGLPVLEKTVSFPNRGK